MKRQKQTSISSFFKRPVKSSNGTTSVNKTENTDQSYRTSNGSVNSGDTKLNQTNDQDSKENTPISNSLKRYANENEDTSGLLKKNKTGPGPAAGSAPQTAPISAPIAVPVSDPVPNPVPATLSDPESAPVSDPVVAPVPAKPYLPTQRKELYEFRKSNPSDKSPQTEEQRKLHNLFLAKLGKPGSLEKIIQRLRQNGSDEIADQSNDTDPSSDDETTPSAKLKKFANPKTTTASTNQKKLTPLEEQYISLKKEYPDAIILVEVGYKYRIYGYDAAIAAKEIGWALVPGKMSIDNSHPSDHLYDKFATCSFPVQSLDRHVKTLVEKGHKVGVVNQMETAAIKSTGTNKSKIMKRELTYMHTKGTFVEEFQYQSQGQFSSLATAGGYLLAVCTDQRTRTSPLHFGILAVRTSTGDIITDEFIDTPLLTEFETRLLHIQPCEVIIIGNVPTNVTTMIKNLSTRGSDNVTTTRIRIESHNRPTDSETSSLINNFYSTNDNIIPPTNLTPLSSTCLAALVEYLKKFKLENVLYLTKNFSSFTSRSHMLLNANTLTSLEIFQNETTYTEKGSLFWIMDHTRTPFGQRLLKTWIAKPLINREQLEERINAVTELSSSYTPKIADLTQIMRRLPDMEKGLVRLYYKRCSPKQLYYTLDFLREISVAFTDTDPEKVGFKSKLLNDLFAALPKAKNIVINALSHIDASAAKSDNKENFFKEDDFEEYESIVDQKMVRTSPCFASGGWALPRPVARSALFF